MPLEHSGRKGKCREPTLVYLSKALVLTVVLVGLYFVFLARFQLGFDLQSIRCLPFQVWITNTADHRVARGDYVEFRADERVSRFFQPGSRFLKEVIAEPGDHVVVKEGVVIVNARPLAELNLAQTIGKPPSAFDRDFIVPKGHYWVMGTHPYSYDSRYWGTVNQRQIIGQSYPVW